MYRIISPAEAASLIRDGDCLLINCFLSLGHTDAIHRAVYERFCATGHPRDLTLISSAGYGERDETSLAEAYVGAGAVRQVITSHYTSMPATTRLIAANKLEGYSIPLGTISHALRTMAGGQKSFLTQLGVGLYVDPRLDGPAMNAVSRQELVRLVEVDGEEYLKYTLPVPNVCLIKGTAVDPLGNITFDDEYIYADALAAAQVTHNSGGTVIVQVDRTTHQFARPRYVIVPGMLVDAVVVAEPAQQTASSQTLSGSIHVPPLHMDYWMGRLNAERVPRRDSVDQSAHIIGRRAARELKAGQIVNIGIGLPEMVGRYAVEANILKDITLTVESGGVGGLPAPGASFGATIGADMVSEVAAQFDFYDGGGLDICFMGALEVDCRGNVNVHRRPDRYVGIGGFANITAAARTVVFCLNFRSHKLSVKEEEGKVRLEREGEIEKLKPSIRSISFSAGRALAKGQRVLYVTERCVFELTESGLTLTEVYPGVDLEGDILSRLDFTPELRIKETGRAQ